MSRTSKPELTFRQIWNLCFGFLGIQFGFALQNANVSRIFQTLGARVDDIPILWVAAPLTGLIVQPLIGHYSDRTWNRLGRRRPYFLAGALLATLALLAMPNAPVLWVAAGLLWIMDASFNVSMEPFRAFVADQLPTAQRPLGYAMQSFLIGVGGVIASMLPWLLAKAGVANVAAGDAIPDTVRYAFYAGAIVLLAAVGWTVHSTREYPPDQLAAFSDSLPVPPRAEDRAAARRQGLLWLGAGLVAVLAVALSHLDYRLYLLAGGLLAFGLGMLWLGFSRREHVLTGILADLRDMPVAMRRLAWVQFFSWFAMFALWTYTTPAVTAVQFGSSNPLSGAYNAGANWVGVLFGAYNGFAVFAALIIPQLVRWAGVRWTHVINLVAAAVGLASFLWVRDPRWLLVSMLGVGFGWASILSLPYTLLADNLPAEKMGIYMGIFNFFVVIPQLLAASVLGVLLKTFFAGQAVFGLVLGGVSLALAGLCTLRVAEPSAGVLKAAAPAPQS